MIRIFYYSVHIAFILNVILGSKSLHIFMYTPINKYEQSL